MIDVRRLRLLAELAREGTIAAVARKLDYSASAVSQQLIALEREAGVPLLERDGRRVRLTPAAHALVERADRIFIELEAAQADLDRTRGDPAGPLTLAAFPSALTRLVVPALAQLRTRYPGLAPTVLQSEPEQGIRALRAGHVDILVSKHYGATAPPTGGLDHRPLLQEPVLVIGPASRQASPAVELGDLAHERWIAGASGTAFGELVEQACRAVGFEPDIAHRADDVAVQLALVDAGFGLTMLPGLAVPEAHTRQAQTMSPTPTRHIDAITRRGADRRPVVSVTLTELARAAKTALDGLDWIADAKPTRANRRQPSSH